MDTQTPVTTAETCTELHEKSAARHAWSSFAAIYYEGNGLGYWSDDPDHDYVVIYSDGGAYSINHEWSELWQ